MLLGDSYFLGYRLIAVLLFAGLAFPVPVFADQCAVSFERASRLANMAHQEADQGRYVRSARLYRSAAREFRRVSKRKDCECPVIASTAGKYADLEQSNAEGMQKEAAVHKAMSKKGSARRSKSDD